MSFRGSRERPAILFFSCVIRCVLALGPSAQLAERPFRIWLASFLTIHGATFTIVARVRSILLLLLPLPGAGCCSSRKHTTGPGACTIRGPLIDGNEILTNLRLQETQRPWSTHTMSAPAHLRTLGRCSALPARSRLAAQTCRASRASAVTRPWNQRSMPAFARARGHLLQTRAFTTTRINRLADVADESFDPKSVDRESDEVDVCIVGGGRPKRAPLGPCLRFRIPSVSLPPVFVC